VPGEGVTESGRVWKEGRLLVHGRPRINARAKSEMSTKGTGGGGEVCYPSPPAPLPRFAGRGEKDTSALVVAVFAYRLDSGCYDAVKGRRMSKKLFISHSTKDDEHVNRIADALEGAGFNVWVDHRSGIPEGTPNWDRAIRRAIVDADISILLMSERSLASDICAAECLLVRELGDPLYVMRLEACRPENVWLYIKMIQ
jgi:hypothetical protein